MGCRCVNILSFFFNLLKICRQFWGILCPQILCGPGDFIELELEFYQCQGEDEQVAPISSLGLAMYRLGLERNRLLRREYQAVRSGAWGVNYLPIIINNPRINDQLGKYDSPILTSMSRKWQCFRPGR